MAERKRKPSKSKAAEAEAKGKAKTMKWHGLTLKLPEELLGDLMFAFADFEEQQRNGEARVGPMLSLIETLVGKDQYRSVRAKVSSEKLSMEKTWEALFELLEGLLEKYGMGLGES
jgi:hypothetical protein